MNIYISDFFESIYIPLRTLDIGQLQLPLPSSGFLVSPSVKRNWRFFGKLAFVILYIFLIIMIELCEKVCPAVPGIKYHDPPAGLQKLQPAPVTRLRILHDPYYITTYDHIEGFLRKGNILSIHAYIFRKCSISGGVCSGLVQHFLRYIDPDHMMTF